VYNGAILTDLKSDLEVDTNDKSPLKALSNPISLYKLVTETYNTFKDLESNLCKFITFTSFNIIRLKAFNKVNKLSYNIILFSC